MEAKNHSGTLIGHLCDIARFCKIIGSSRNSGKNYLKSNIALARKQTAASHLKRFLGQGIRD
jgi:hypothetical protein